LAWVAGEGWWLLDVDDDDAVDADTDLKEVMDGWVAP